MILQSQYATLAYIKRGVSKLQRVVTNIGNGRRMIVRNAPHRLLPHSSWWRSHGPLVLAGLAGLVGLALLLTACGGEASASIPPTQTPSAPATATPTGVRVGCSHSDQPAFQSNARLTLTPTHGPVGTQVTVDASGLQPGCGLLLGISVAPALAETGGTPIAAPRLADEALRWVSVTDTGTIHTTFCVCQTIPVYTIGTATHVSETPEPGFPLTGKYGPQAGDYFFITLAGAGIPNPPPLYARFTVTK